MKKNQGEKSLLTHLQQMLFIYKIHTGSILVWARLPENHSENTAIKMYGETEFRKLKFTGNFQSCLTKCANTV